MKTCIQCGKPFEGKPTKQYCGVTCRRRASHLRELAADPAKQGVKEEERGTGVYVSLTNPSIAGVRSELSARERAQRTAEPIRITAASETVRKEFDLVDAIGEPGTCYLL